MLPAMARRSGIFWPLYGSSPFIAASSSGGSPMPISTSPFCTRGGFCVPPPGMTLMLSPAFSRSSSAMPPEIAYHPPPTAPAVHVRLCCAATGSVAPSAATRIATTNVTRFIVCLLGVGLSAPWTDRGCQTVVRHADERRDVEHGTARLALHVGRVRRHVGALEHDGADVGMLRDEPPRDAHVLRAR